jgi:ABC-2 type transport system ATP-binding protein
VKEDLAIEVKNLEKAFKLPHEKNTSIKSLIVNFYRQKRGYEKQVVLKDVSFEVKKGEFFGIIGRNGSGKSTLLKLLAGIYTPNEGTIVINGSLTPFIELGVGFNMELTGRENVFLNGALLGFSRKEMDAMYDDIVEFAELERFMDQKLKNYSSGMQVRLAFSIAIRAKSDILLIDEVLAVGDASFQQKCFEVFAELKKTGTTIVLVTHDMSSAMRFCDRAILIDSGNLTLAGKTADIADAYLELNYEATENYHAKNAKKQTEDKTKPTIGAVTIHDHENNEKSTFTSSEKLRITANYKNPKGLPTHFGLQVFNDAGVYCFGTNTKLVGKDPVTKTSGKVTVTLSPKLIPGNYYITLASMNDNATTVYNYKAKVAEFRIAKDTRLEGVVLLDHSWEM